MLHYHHSEMDARGLCDELNALRSDSAVLMRADLSVNGELEQLAQAAMDTWGGVDVLVNNASLFQSGPFGGVAEADWNGLLAANLKAPFFLSQALLPSLRQRSGCIVNLADIHAETGLPGYPVYSIAKAGVVAMTRCLAKELAPGVRVNAVAPGAILWPEHNAAEDRAEILKKVALQRCGEADDIARAVKFLIEDAGYVTGQVLNVDGGRSLFR